MSTICAASLVTAEVTRSFHRARHLHLSTIESPTDSLVVGGAQTSTRQAPAVRLRLGQAIRALERRVSHSIHC